MGITPQLLDPVILCDSDTFKSLKSLFYFGKIWISELKFLLCLASDWKIKEGRYITMKEWKIHFSCRKERHIL